jgi:hypothetical protein
MSVNSVSVDQFVASFSQEDWRRVVHALQTYVINEEESLSTQNVGDREWDRVAAYGVLANDINLYVLGGKA